MGGSTHSTDGRYDRIPGSVFLQSAPAHLMGSTRARGRLQLLSVTPGDPAKIASVAVSRERRSETARRFGRFFETDDISYWNIAGNNAATALFAGDLGAIVEVKPVTLHDSALLIPYTILGGRTYYLDSAEAFNYLDLYEAMATAEQQRVVRPYVATMHEDLATRLTDSFRLADDGGLI